VTASVFHQFRIELPVFQAPIGSIASPELAAAVCNAGGVGHLACTWRSPAQLKDIFAAMKAQTQKPFGANFVFGFPFEERLALALDHGVPVISFFGATPRLIFPG
jgi:nitronate monooxygenase